jgi:hypothetical protein
MVFGIGSGMIVFWVVVCWSDINWEGVVVGVAKPQALLLVG